MDQVLKPGSPASDDGPLDSYSETVMRVAETVTPHVAAIEMTGNRRNGRFRVGAGSAVLFTSDGYLLTNSHVVAGTHQGHAVFADGSRTDLELVGADALSDLAVVRGRAPKVPPAEFGDAGGTFGARPRTTARSDNASAPTSSRSVRLPSAKTAWPWWVPATTWEFVRR